MNPYVRFALLGALGIGIFTGYSLLRADPPSSVTSQTPAEAELLEPDFRVPLNVAKDRARVLQNTFASTLEVMHRHYFRSDHAVLPARAMEDLFAATARESGVRARWIAVNTQPMSVQHQPRTDFERRAARELADGEETVDAVQNGYYWHAGRIPLGNGCVSCHTRLFGGTPTSPRFAGLVISIPLTAE